jgi:Transposase DNA-binding/Transposase DDE domain
MLTPILDALAWAKAQFGKVILGDARRTDRAVKVAAAMAEGGAENVPLETDTLAEARAAYRLFDKEDVTHEAITRQHRDQVIAAAREANDVVFFIHDDSLLDFSHRHSLTGLGPIGNGRGRGFIAHSCLAALADGRVLGLAHQAVWVRTEKAQKKKRSKKVRSKKLRSKKARSKKIVKRTEAAVWEEDVAAIGRCPKGKTWISLGDRGADVFTHFEACLDLGWQCLVRLAHDRVLLDGGRLLQKARSLAPMAQRVTEVKGKDVSLTVSWFDTKIKRPAACGPGSLSIACSVVRVWNDAEALDWILLSTLPVTTAQAAFERVDWYKSRWLIEEFHKGLKTGCKIERSQLRTAERFLPLLGVASIVAVRRLQVRADARAFPDDPAAKEERTIEVPALALDHPADTVRTNRGFARGVATLGGFRDRKGDGEPGWQTISRGLLAWLAGARSHPLRS